MRPVLVALLLATALAPTAEARTFQDCVTWGTPPAVTTQPCTGMTVGSCNRDFSTGACVSPSSSGVTVKVCAKSECFLQLVVRFDA